MLAGGLCPPPAQAAKRKRYRFVPVFRGLSSYYTFKEEPMGKIVMTISLPELKVRKTTAKAVQYHKDKTKYCRKAKHKGPLGETPEGLKFAASVFAPRPRVCDG
jgi:hypothetical protein